MPGEDVVYVEGLRFSSPHTYNSHACFNVALKEVVRQEGEDCGGVYRAIYEFEEEPLRSKPADITGSMILAYIHLYISFTHLPFSAETPLAALHL